MCDTVTVEAPCWDGDMRRAKGWRGGAAMGCGRRGAVLKGDTENAQFGNCRPGNFLIRGSCFSHLLLPAWSMMACRASPTQNHVKERVKDMMLIRALRIGSSKFVGTRSMCRICTHFRGPRQGRREYIIYIIYFNFEFTSQPIVIVIVVASHNKPYYNTGYFVLVRSVGIRDI